jgi:hypothetical protein
MIGISLCTVFAANTAFAANAENIPKINLPVMSKAPVIDGKIDPSEWADATGMCGLDAFGGTEMFPAAAWFWVGRDKEKLYIALKTEVGSEGILDKIKPQGRTNPLVFADETIELVFIPELLDGKGKIFHTAINNRGAYYAVAQDGSATVPWKIDFKSSGAVRDGYWEFEIAFPLRNFGLNPEKMPVKSGLRIVRNWLRLYNGPDYCTPSTWGQKKIAFFSNNAIPEITWDKNAPVVQVRQLKDSKDPLKPSIKLSLRNPTPAPVKCKLDYSFRPSASHSIKDDTVISLAPGETKDLDLPVVQTSNNEYIDTVIKVSSEDGKQIYYNRDFRWRTERPAHIFADKRNSTESRTAFNFAYFPSYNKMTLQVDLSNEPNPHKIKSMKVTIKGPDGKELASTAMPAVVNKVSRQIWEIPDLKPIAAANGGKAAFTIALTLDDGKNTRVEKNFERFVMEWEGTSLGKSDLIIPPFKPIEVSGNKLKTLLRIHELNNLGLWKQVVADGVPLLKENGMRLEAVVDGKKFEATATDFKFSEKKPTTVETSSVWQAGQLSGQAVARWDYDGMMKYVLTIAPCNKKVDSLKLVIPLDNSYSPLLHACADGARMNFVGFAPKGDGRIWDSSKNARNSIIGSYLPYIWLGTETVGVSVFGENDRGWVTSPKIPCQELVRKGDTLYLVLNLISEPLTIETSRKILIGFQATPVKPMPDNWRRWTSWDWLGKQKIKDSAYEMTFLGSGLYYGAIGACLELYPRDEDVTLWKMMKKCSKDKILPEEYIKEWVKGCRIPGKEGEEKYESTKKTYEIHLRAGFRSIAGPNVLFYTNARGALFDSREGRTFVDEWYRLPFSTRDYPPGGGVAYDVDPVESFRDYAMYWYKKMFEDAGCKNIYWDCIFPVSIFNLVGTEAYVLPNGDIQPATGIFNMRELVRRCAILQMEMGGKPMNMVHMTSTAIVPILSFAQMNYDWEDNLGSRDYQDRYTRDYLRVMSIGRQTGNYPVVMSMISCPKEQYAWCERTATGVMLTHELRWGRGTQSGVFWDELKRLFDFGYGNPNVKVFNYWDKYYPVSTPGHESASLVVSKPGAAMLVVCDWGNGGDYSLQLDLAKLGLKEGFAATNVTDGKVLETKGDKLMFKLKKHDYVIIGIKQNP